MHWQAPEWLWLVIGAIALVAALRPIALPRGRRWLALACRALAWLLLVATVAGLSGQITVTRQAGIVYAVDLSESISPQQQQWIVDRLVDVDHALPERLPRALIGFAKQPVVLRPWHVGPLPSAEAVRGWLEAGRRQVDRSATHLEAALLKAVQLCEADQGAAILGFTDGHETVGDAARVTRLVQQRGLTLYVEAPPHEPISDLRVAGLYLPEAVKLHAPMAIQATIENRSGEPQPAVIEVLSRGESVLRQERLFNPGLQLVSLPYTAREVGELSLEFTIAAQEDVVASNNQRSGTVHVVEPPRLLYVVDPLMSGRPLILELLRRRGLQVDWQTVDRLPESPALADYAAVVMTTPVLSRVGQVQAERLAQYVKTLGGGLLVIGAGETQPELAPAAKALAELLPVEFEPRRPEPEEKPKRVGVALLIDRSNSMTRPQLFAAKQAAVELLRQLQPQDFIGVYAFDVEVYPILEYGPVSQAIDAAVEQLVRIRAGGGTDAYPAIALAANRLAAVDLEARHIVLLSDGNTMPRPLAQYEELFGLLKQLKVSVSAMTIGEQDTNHPFMQWVALSTGGQAYRILDDTQIPRIILADTEWATKLAPFEERRIQPLLAPGGILTGFQQDELPGLQGFWSSRLQSGAQLSMLATPDQPDEPIRPLLAHWQVGRGRVAVFTSDAEARWTRAWLAWNRFEAFWLQVADWVMRQHQPGEFFLRVVREPHAPPALEIEFPEAPTIVQPARAELVSGSSAVQPASLKRLSPRQWRVSLPHLASGPYRLRLIQEGLPAAPTGDPRAAQAGEGGVRVTHERGFSVDDTWWGQRREEAGSPPHEALLAQLASGRELSVEALAHPPATTTTTPRDLSRWLVPLAMLLFLADIAIRGGTML